MRGSPVSLAHASLRDLSPLELVNLAATACFDSVGLTIAGEGARYDFRHHAALYRDTQARLADVDIGVLEIESIRLDADARPGDFESLIETSAALGAKYVVVVGRDDDAARLTDKFAELCVRAEGFGIRPVLEFTPTSGVRTLWDADRIVGDSPGGVLVDVLHLHRCEGDGTDLIELDADRLPMLQLADAAERAPSGGRPALVAESREGRVPPGMGGLDLDSVLDGCPLGDVAISVEAPSTRLRARIGDLAFVRLLRDSVDVVLKRHERYPAPSSSCAVAVRR